MQKNLLFFLLLLAMSAPPVCSQPVLKGIVLKNISYYLNKGDTITIRAIRKEPISLSGKIIPGDTIHYFLDDPAIKGNTITILAKNVQLLPDDLTFWESAWFLMSSEAFIGKGWRKKSRDSMETESRRLLQQMEEWKQIFHDPYLDDYFRRILDQIHPSPMISLKGPERHFRLYITLQDYEQPVVHADGTILASISWLTGFKNEREMIQALAGMVCHSVGDHFISFAASGTRYEQTATLHEKRYAEYFAQKFMETLPTDSRQTDTLLFTRNIATAITREVWRFRELREYKNAEQAVDRLITAGITTDEVYLLKAMLLRTYQETATGNLEALAYIQKAERSAVHLPIELTREKGLIFLELARYKDALIAFEQHLEELLTANGTYEDIKWTRDMIFKCQLLAESPPSVSP
ncbi:MAG: hypothetical protein R3D00_22290 [Bacteroidia bacterium]